MINRKLNTTPILPTEVRPGGLFRFGIEWYVCTEFDGQIATIERLQKDFAFSNMGFPVTDTENYPPFTLYHHEVEDYDLVQVLVHQLQPIELWTACNSIWDLPFKELGFIAEPLGVYWKQVGKYRVTAKDCFLFNECVVLSIEEHAPLNLGYKTIVADVASMPIWYLHELQNAIYDYCGEMPLNQMGRRLLHTRKTIE